MPQKYHDKHTKKIQKERIENAPRKHPPQRPRALTYPLPPPPLPQKPTSPLSAFLNLFKESQKTHNQTQSLFARLPYEIREIIWLEVLSGHVLHIVRARKKLVAIACPEGPDNDDYNDDDDVVVVVNHKPSNCWNTASGHNLFQLRKARRCRDRLYYRPLQTSHSSKAMNLLPLLRTCRLIYTETLPFLYGKNVFDINHLDTLLYMKLSVSRRRLNQIRYLRFTWDFKNCTGYHSPAPYDLGTWQEACKMLRGLEGLQEVTVYLYGFIFTAKPSQQGWWGPALDKLQGVRVRKMFDVVLPWTEEECEQVEEGKGYLFRLLGTVDPNGYGNYW